MKKVLHLTLFLALVAAIAGGALALANSLTAPIVAANALAAEKQNLQLIFPDAADCEVQISGGVVVGAGGREDGTEGYSGQREDGTE